MAHGVRREPAAKPPATADCPQQLTRALGAFLERSAGDEDASGEKVACTSSDLLALIEKKAIGDGRGCRPPWVSVVVGWRDAGMKALPMALEPTIYDIAKRAQVGIATVSRVLNGSEGVAQATRAAVQSAMNELGYRPNRAARRLAVRGPNRPRVAAIMPFFSTNFYFTVSRPISQGLAAAEMDLVLYDIENREAKLRLLDRLVAERSCEGLLMCSMGIGPERQEQFARLGIPVVCIDYPLSGVPSVTVDNLAGGVMATDYLVRAGSRRIGLVTGPSAALAIRLREEGFVRTASTDAPLARADAITRQGGREACAALLDGHPSVDGIVCVNDLLAVGVIEELRARGRRIPEDVQVIGFDDQPLMDVLGLTTVRQPMLAFGEWAARAIQALITDPRSPVASVQLSLSLIPRTTTRPLADASAARPSPRAPHRPSRPKAKKERP
ncbi:MAG: LacI family DNA-binding transcriptional regulator [Planctomycetes bacterium]|nr:LacI family DNA-binding transcriptional regulator [Planctomycetota bacterium]